jgi:hypothetical protein
LWSSTISIGNGVEHIQGGSNTALFIMARDIKIIIALCVALLLTILLVKCNISMQNIEHQLGIAEKEVIEAKAREAAANVIVDSIKTEVKRRDSNIVVAKTQIDSSKKELAKTKVVVGTLTQRIRQAQLDKDTVTIVVSCDSLVAEVETLYGALESYQHFADTLSIIYDEQLLAKDSIIAVKDKLYFDMRTSFNRISDNYISLHKKSQRSEKKLKGAKTLNKVLGAVAIVLVGVIIAK